MKRFQVFDSETNETIDISDQFDGEWKPYEGETDFDGPIYVQRIDEPFEWATTLTDPMTYEAGDYVAIGGTMDDGPLMMWPVEATELSVSDGRAAAARRYYSMPRRST